MKRKFPTTRQTCKVCVLTTSTQLEAESESNREMCALKGSPLRTGCFENLMIDAVDEALTLLGSSSKRAIYFHLETAFKIEKGDIPNKIEEFANAIETIFGDGARFLEIQIMKQLYEKVGHVFEYFPEDNNLVFSEYVQAARLSSSSC